MSSETMHETNGVSYRWVDGVDATAEDWDRIERLLESHGWMSLNAPTSRILIAENAEGELLAFHVFQFLPHCGPLYVRPSARGTGIAEELADRMLDFLIEAKTRGWIVIAESQHAEKLCEARGMERVKMPVYVMVNPGGTEV